MKRIGIDGAGLLDLKHDLVGQVYGAGISLLPARAYSRTEMQVEELVYRQVREVSNTVRAEL